MNAYHKIQTVFMRDPATKFRTLLEGEYTLPVFRYLADCDWLWTEKVDGTNIRVIFDKNQISFLGKTDKSQIPSFLLNKLKNTFLPQLPLFSEKFPLGVCLYGEGYGSKIQKGGENYTSDHDFVLFDVKINGHWLTGECVEGIAGTLGINYVPIIGCGTLIEMVAAVKYKLKSKWGDFPAEGIVARPKLELFTSNNIRVITKLKTKDFRK